MNYYTTGVFAKMANVSQRTIRYYDNIGLLKPSMIAENGYRKYSDIDFLRLQKILSLRYLGFTIEEIFPLISNDKEGDFAKSLAMQMHLIDMQIAHFQSLRDAMRRVASSLENKTFKWDFMVELIKMMNVQDEVVEQYKNSNNLKVRIALHDRFSLNKQGWYEWIFEKLDFSRVNRLIELGCGNGKLWHQNKVNLRNREIFLSDKSPGMVEEIKKTLGNDFNCIVAECENIPFKDEYFDTVIANHVLFYISDMEQGLLEIFRVLKPGGYLYCTTYSENHMREISKLVKEFDERIELSSKLYEKFGLDNGEALLKPHCSSVKRYEYPDGLIIDEVQPLVDYIFSCHGNQVEIIGNRVKEFHDFIADKMKAKGYIEIHKEAGLLVGIKKDKNT